ncbi:uncharacterized protein LOC129582285 isoform X2 [Paramacrobiotus metropolitanus]|uniref:uncharacterized protein LOC129582285 isoform X2 n=1 Tax=Paramacrobiotus metropolitanus TaxID=2943436 RepID=UPI002446290E|nr:uncharacterized protein LOC129582285 isoform X2 [Paramacrobiotus metropolitanus]
MIRRVLAGSLYWRRACGRAAGAERRGTLRRPLRIIPADCQTVAEAGLPLYDHIVNQPLRAFAEPVPIRWRDLGRQVAASASAEPSRHSIISLPNPCIVPGGRFRAVYWDSFWTLQGLLVSGMTDTAKGVLLNFAYLIDQYGFIPNGNRVYYIRQSEPPVLALMIDHYIKHPNVPPTDADFVLRKMLPYLEKEYKFWMKERSTTFHFRGQALTLNRYTGGGLSTPRPESYFEDYHHAQEILNKSIQSTPTSYGNVAAGAESGLDFSTRWLDSASADFLTIRTRSIVPVDLNALLCATENVLSDLYQLTGDPVRADSYRQLALDRGDAIQSVFWNSRAKMWRDYDLRRQDQRPTFYLSLLTPAAERCSGRGVDITSSEFMADLLTSRDLIGVPCGIPNGQAPVRREGTKPDTGGGARPGGFLVASVGSRFPGAVRRLPLLNPHFTTVRHSSGAFIPEAPIFPADALDIIERIGVIFSARRQSLPEEDGARADASAKSGSFPVEEVVATLQRDGYAAVRVQLAQLFSVAGELAPRQRLLLASACQLILLQRRSRLRVLSATLAAPGELSDTALHALRKCRDTEREVVVDVACGLSRALQYAVAEDLRVELNSVVEPLVGQLWTGGNREFTMARFLTVLNTLLTSVGRLISGQELPETVEMANKPDLIRDLDQVEDFVDAQLFETDVEFAVGMHSDYDAADWEYFANEYRGACRILVHMNWTYAVVHATDVHSGAANELMDAVKKQLNGKSKDFVALGEVDLEGIVDRLGCGIVHLRKVDKILKFSKRLTGKFPNPAVIACEVSFTHETITHLFVEAANLLGPTTDFQYCIVVKVNDEPPEKDAFWANLYVFHRVSHPRTKPPTTDEDSCRPAHNSLPVGSGHTAEYEVSGEKVTNRQVETMTAAEILRVFDMHLVFHHRADERNINDRVQFDLDILYPDGSSRLFTVLLEDDYFDYVLDEWQEYWKKQAAKKSLAKLYPFRICHKDK